MKLRKCSEGYKDMGLFDKVVNLIFEDEELGKQQSGSTQQSAKPTPRDRVQSQSLQKKVDDEVYKEFSQSLQAAMEAENLPGFDLYEFHQLYKQAVSNGKSVKDAFYVALKATETMRVSKESLIEHYAHYKAILDKQKDVFEKDLNSYYDDNIKDPKTDKDSLDKELNEKIAQLQKLQDEVEALRAQRKSIGLDTDSAESQVSEVKSSFNKAYNEVNNELSTIVDILKSM